MKPVGVFSNKKKKTDKFGKTMQKLPDLNNVGQIDQVVKKHAGGGFASDSDEHMNQQLPMIKGGSNIQNYNKISQKNSDVNILNTTNQTTYATGSDTTVT